MYSRFLNRIATVRFLLDTGASITAISEVDAIRNKIDYNKLSPAPSARGVGSIITAYYLPNCDILFKTDIGNSYVENLPNVSVFKTEDYQTGGTITDISLLGIDILTKFSIHFKDDSMILEKT